MHENMADTVKLINTFLEQNGSPLRVSLPALDVEQLYRESHEPHDPETYRCFHVLNHRALPGVDACEKLWQVDIGDGQSVYLNHTAPMKKSHCKGPCDVFDPWVRWERGQVGI